MSRYEHGRVLAVNETTLGSELVGAHAAGVSSLTVEDPVDFDEDGGWLSINGQVVEYTTYDDDTGEITLVGTLDAAAGEGDRVDLWDELRQVVTVDKIAQVELDGDDDNTDPLEATIPLHLLDDLAEGIRGIRGESVLLEQDGDEWRIVDVLGLAADGASGTQFWQDAHTVPAGASAWMKTPNYVFAPDGSPEEQNAVQEAIVKPDPSGLHQLRMWYTAGWENPVGIKVAWSDDGGATWTREPGGYVIGNGAAGVAGPVAHTGMIEEPDGTLHLVFGTTGMTIQPLQAVSSTDGGLTWGNLRTILTKSGWERGQWGNSSGYVTPDGTWHLLYEAYDTSNIWQTGYATSPDGLTWTRQNGGQPLTTLRVGTGIYGGCDLHYLEDGTWELFYHASTSGLLPTDIYRATSSDLINWTRDPAPIVARSQSWEGDQTADPTVFDLDGDRVMIYSGVSNPNGPSYFGRAVYEPAVASAQTILLRHEPIQNSEHLYWNGLYQPASVWSRSGRTVTVPDTAGDLQAGDELVVEYAYRVGLSEGMAFEVDATMHVAQYGAGGSIVGAQGYAESPITLEDGVTYEMTIDGNATSYDSPPTTFTYGVGNTVPVKYLSAGQGQEWSGYDAEFLYAAPDVAAASASNHHHGITWSLDAGADQYQREEEPVGGVPPQYRPDFTYTYRIVGKGYPIRVIWTDGNLTNNNGVARITLRKV